MDYQKSEQEKHYDDGTNKFKYEPTGLSDVIDLYKPIDYAPLGKVATEEDVRNYEDDLLQLHYDLDGLKADSETKDNEVSDKQAEIFKKGEDVQAKKNEHTKAQKHWFELNTELTEVKKKLAQMAAVIAAAATAASAGTPTKPIPGATSENIAKGKAKEKEIEDEMLVVDADMVTLQAEILTLDTEKLKLDGELPILQKEYRKISKKIQNKENEIQAKEREIGQVKQNIVENKEALQILNKKNKETTRKYTETFNMTNRDRYSVQQDPNEDDQDYIARIKQIETATYDPNIFKEKATHEGN